MQGAFIVSDLFPIRSAYEAGVTYAVASLASYSGLIGGLSATIRTGARHALERGAIIQDVTALHATIERIPWGSGYVSTSSQINVLRNLLLGSHEGVTKSSATGYWFGKVTTVSSTSEVPGSSAVTHGYFPLSRVRYLLLCKWIVRISWRLS